MKYRDTLITLAGCLIAVGITWGVFTQRIQSLEAKAVEFEERIGKKDEQFLHVSTELATISTNIEWIKKHLQGN